MPDEAEDSLDNSETVSLKAESLSGDSVRGSLSWVAVLPLFVVVVVVAVVIVCIEG